ncbi:MAG: phosphatase PAP2 family protein [Formosimonas sp.]
MPTPIFHRLRHLIISWAVVGLLYSLAQLTPLTPTLLSETRWDAAIAFNPNAIGWYLSFFVLIPTAFALIRADFLPILSRAMQWAGLIAAVIFVCYPTRVTTPMAHVGWGAIGLEWLKQYDTSQNCLPSLHAALTVIAAWGISHNTHSRRGILALAGWIWAGLIACSIMQVRRHLLLDVSAGLVLGGVALCLSHRFMKTRP